MEILGPNTAFYLHVLALGAVAGLTIFLGLPVAFYRGSLRARAALSAASVGILLFLFVEISYLLVENIEVQVQLAAAGVEEAEGMGWQVLILVSGFAIGLLGLRVFESRLVAPAPEAVPIEPRRLAILIALGIGLHNFSEGLVIGQAFLTGSLSLGYTLVIGFALHNATEGFGIAAPIAGTRPAWGFLLLAGLLAGGPTFLGTVVGVSYTSATLEALFSALAAGAILYIVIELVHVGRRQAGPLTAGAGLLAGFFLAFGSDLAVEGAMSRSVAAGASTRQVEIDAGDYFFRPARIDLQAGEPTALVLHNRGSVDHEIEILGLGPRLERRVPAGSQATLILNPRHPGPALFICDMPGHLSGGMWGRIYVHDAPPTGAPSAGGAFSPPRPSSEPL